jgi:hypothetical protein
MKKSHMVTLIMLMSIFIYTGAAHAQFSMGLRMTGPISYIKYCDFNEYVDVWNDFYVGLNVSMDKMHWVPEFGAEILVSPLALIEFGFGASIINGSNEVSISASGVSYLDITHKLRVYPFTLTAYVEPPLPFGYFKPLVYGGVGLYRTRITFDYYTFNPSTDVVEEHNSELTKMGFGLHGGAGLEFSVFPRVTVDFGVKARWAVIKGFEGTKTYLDGTEEDVFLQAGPDADGDYYYGPESTEYKNEYKEGEVDLSGFGFVIGLKVMF